MIANMSSLRIDTCFILPESQYTVCVLVHSAKLEKLITQRPYL